MPSRQEECLDRMVGYKISPVLWAKVKRGLSAGRVQSVAVRIIADREEEISAFIPEEYWSIGSRASARRREKAFDGKAVWKSGRQADHSFQRRNGSDLKRSRGSDSWEVLEVKKGERTKKAPLPFTTSTLQQEASKALNFSTQKTMRIAQQLYEGIDVKGNGTVGLITYLRTDSTRISEEADQAARTYVKETYGDAV